MVHPAKPEIDAVFARYAEAWTTSAPDALKPFWDESADPLYLAEEIDETLSDWRAVEAYWSMNAGLHADVALRFTDGVVHDLEDRLVIAAYRMHWRIAFKNKPAMAGDNRVAAVLRRSGEGWRFKAWIEAPLAAITYMRKLYEARA